MLRVYSLIATLQTFINERFEDRKDRGATAVEYGLLVGLIAIVIIGAVGLFGEQLEGVSKPSRSDLKASAGLAVSPLASSLLVAGARCTREPRQR